MFVNILVNIFLTKVLTSAFWKTCRDRTFRGENEVLKIKYDCYIKVIISNKGIHYLFI